MLHRLPLCILLVASLVLIANAQKIKLNINRPYNDISEQYVSFLIKPEDLYAVLDGPKRKEITRMAAYLGPAYVKLSGDFFFATKTKNRVRSSTMIIWEGFNRWTSAVNWKMIIPVPYAPGEWDSVRAFEILDASYRVGITSCIWQFGLDFGATTASEYINDMNVFKLMVEAFQPYVDDWSVVGADISAGSSVEETRRYLAAAKSINSAFGWTQSPNVWPALSMGSYLYEHDPALRVVLSQTKPVWLTLPLEAENAQKIAKLDSTAASGVIEGLRWAQTLGDAATRGFDVIFREVSATDWVRPNYSFYVTSLYKKVMGSRVFPARVLNKLAPSNKLYAHCANGISGGLALMVVNTEDKTQKISVRKPFDLQIREYWQYVLSMDKQMNVLLNDNKLALNTTLSPLTTTDEPSQRLEFITPGMSVSFWVLPTINAEHCQYTEVPLEQAQLAMSESQRSTANYTAVERLVQKLIEDASVSRAGFRRRRRFVLQDEHKSEEKHSILAKLLRPFASKMATSTHKKREISQPLVDRKAAQNWFNAILNQTRELAQDLLQKREAIATDLARNKRDAVGRTAPKVRDIMQSQEDEDEMSASDVHMKYIEKANGEVLPLNVPAVESAEHDADAALKPVEFYEMHKEDTEQRDNVAQNKTAGTLQFEQRNATVNGSQQHQIADDFTQNQKELGQSFLRELQANRDAWDTDAADTLEAATKPNASHQVRSRVKRAVAVEERNTNMIERDAELLPLQSLQNHRFRSISNNVMKIPSRAETAAKYETGEDAQSTTSFVSKIVDRLGVRLSKLLDTVGKRVHGLFQTVMQKVNGTQINNEASKI